MRARVRYLHSPDAEPDEFAPADPRDATLFIQVMTGPQVVPGSDEPEGEESFDLEVFTPRALERRVREEGPRSGRHLVIADRWDYPTIAAYLFHLFESEEGRDWDELGERLGHFGRWEFEDYNEEPERGPLPGVGAVVRAIDGLDDAPHDVEDFRLSTRVTVGAGKGAGEGRYSVEVCTARALERRVAADTIVRGEHLLIVDHWDATAIAAALTRLFESVDGADWPELADRLARFGAPARDGY